MDDRAYRGLTLTIVACALLVALPGPTAAEENPTRAAREAFRTVAPIQAACGACAAAHKSCFTSCFGLEDKSGMGTCLMQCDNAAATCSCDEQGVTLRSEDLAPFAQLTKAACHGTVSCQPNYPSCASWSGYSDCGDPQCGIYRWCGDCGDPWGCWDLATRQPQERFRVCFNEFGQSCTEWQGTLVLTACGCP
jgi:hypothetical protein